MQDQIELDIKNIKINSEDSYKHFFALYNEEYISVSKEIIKLEEKRHTVVEILKSLYEQKNNYKKDAKHDSTDNIDCDSSSCGNSYCDSDSCSCGDSDCYNNLDISLENDDEIKELHDHDDDNKNNMCIDI